MKTRNNNQPFRYERKFLIADLDRHQIDVIVKSNMALFDEAYPDRYINNVYYDTPGFMSYRENNAGYADRVKYRVRWYGDICADTINPVLELKIKKGAVGTKEQYSLDNISFNRNEIYQDIECSVARKAPWVVSHEFANRQPVLVNRYKRKYYESKCGSYRVTIDSDIHFCRADAGRPFPVDHFHNLHCAVVELKYSVEKDEGAQKIANQFPFRLSRSSKYVSGIALVHA